MLRFMLLAGIFVYGVSFGAMDHSSENRIRALGVAVQHAIFDAEHGKPPSPGELAQLQRDIVVLSQPDLDARSALKLRAIGLAFSRLRNTAANKMSAVASDKTAFTREVVTRAHGGGCANAISLLVDRPVRITLGTGSDAWFYANPKVGSGLRLVTRSNGPDPAIEVFSDCSANSRRITQNDDNVGLDASLAIDAETSDLVFVHLSNAGEPGNVDMLATATAGTISGNVRDAKTAQPISGIYVSAYVSAQSQYEFFAEAYTDSGGNYTLMPSQTGSVYVVASAPGHLVQLYPSGYCPFSSYYSFDINSCDFSHAQALTITATSNTKNVNFSLSTGAQISGQVRDAGNEPLTASVGLYTANNYNSIGVSADAAGHYSFKTLPPGEYFLLAQDNGYSSQYYDHVDCSGDLYMTCDISTATTITVGSTDVSGIDFTLQKLSSFTGVLTSNGQQVGYYNYVDVLDSSGNLVASSNVDSSTGRYVTQNVAPGTYYLYADGSGFYSQLYGGHDCLTSCAAEFAQGVSLTITATGQQIEADFNLDPLPSLQGNITDSKTGEPLPNVVVTLNYSPNAPYFSNVSGTSDVSGHYVVSSIQPAAYFVWAQSPDHIDEIYDGVPCEVPNYYSVQTHCDVSGATPLVVAPGQATLPSADFALAPSGSITGNAIIRADAGSHIPAMTVGINLYDNTGIQIGQSSIDAAGNYAILDLASGTYYAVATSVYSYQYVNQMWQNRDCSSCVPTTSTPIAVSQGQTIGDIDFQLTRIDAVVGRVTDAAGNPITGLVVDLFNTADNSYAGGVPADDQGNYVIAGTVGLSYFVATEAGGGYIDQIYSGISCPSGSAYDGRCSFHGAVPVNLQSNPTQPHIVDFVLQIGDRLFANGFD